MNKFTSIFIFLIVIIGLCISIKLGQLAYYMVLDIDNTLYQPSPKALVGVQLTLNDTLAIETRPLCPQNGH